MEQIKIKHFERDHPGVPFPNFVTLTPVEAQKVRHDFAAKARFDRSDDTWALLTYLLSLSHTLKPATTEGNGIDLPTLLQMAGVTPQDEVYINWDDFRTIDRIAFADLSRYFDDIWYPGPDDIEIFDDGFSWVLFVHHYGAVDAAVLRDAA
jgi:hypothetical protein